MVAMRKRNKKKKHSCWLCKPHKTNNGLRWKNKEFDKLVEFEKIKRGIELLIY